LGVGQIAELLDGFFRKVADESACANYINKLYCMKKDIAMAAGNVPAAIDHAIKIILELESRR
jgi:hypothetical protein